MDHDAQMQANIDRISEGLDAIASGARPAPPPVAPANVLTARDRLLHAAQEDVPPGAPIYSRGPLANSSPSPTPLPAPSFFDRARAAVANLFSPAPSVPGRANTLEKQLNLLQLKSSPASYNKPIPAQPQPVSSPPPQQLQSSPALSPLGYKQYLASVGGNP